MLVPLREVDFDIFVDQAYEMALIPEMTSYPAYYDGIKTKEDFVGRARKALVRDDEGILLFYREDAFCGWIHYFYLAEDRYLDTVSLSARTGTEQMLAEFLEFLERQYPDATAYLGFPQENETALAYLQSRGFTVSEQSWNMALRLPDARQAGSGTASVIRIGRDNYSLFQRLHSQRDGEVYWDTKHILNDLDNWMIFVSLRQGQPAGAVYCQRGAMMDEIFGIDYWDGSYAPDIHKELLDAAVRASRESGSLNLVYFCDDAERQAVMDAGFSCIGKYILVERRV